MVRRSQAPSRHIAALAGAVALVLAFTGCTNNDAKRSDVVDAMTDAGLDDDQAACIGDRFEDEFDQDTLNDLAGADEPADFPDGTEDRVNEILAECTGQDPPEGAGSDEGEGEPSEGEDGGDGSTTTEGSSDTTEADAGG